MKARRVFGVSSCWCRISQTDAGGGTGARIVGRAGTAAVGDLLAGCGVCCRPGAAWDLRRCFVFHPPNSLPPGAVAPHPSSFSCVCVVLCRCGMSCGVSVCFSFGFSWWVRAGLVNSVGLRGRLLGVGRMRVGG